MSEFITFHGNSIFFEPWLTRVAAFLQGCFSCSEDDLAEIFQLLLKHNRRATINVTHDYFVIYTVIAHVYWIDFFLSDHAYLIDEFECYMQKKGLRRQEQTQRTIQNITPIHTIE